LQKDVRLLNFAGMLPAHRLHHPRLTCDLIILDLQLLTKYHEHASHLTVRRRNIGILTEIDMPDIPLCCLDTLTLKYI